MAIDVTPGGPDANSYGTVAEADLYFANRPFSSVWDALTDPEKEAALIYATQVSMMYVVSNFDKKQLPEDATVRVLAMLASDPDRTVVWTGQPADAEQALAWPRIGMKNPNGFDIDSTIVPTRVKHWQFEIAMALQTQDRTAENAAKFAGLTGLKAGPVDLKFAAISDIQDPLLISNATMMVLVPSWFYAFKLVYFNTVKVENI